MTRFALIGATVFDGQVMHPDRAVLVEGGRLCGIVPLSEVAGVRAVPLAGGVLAPGLIDLQVNGGGGVMIDGATDAGVLARVCTAHAGLGTTGLMPTLITDTPAATASVIAAGIDAARDGVRGFLGLHLEGPHLDPRRPGAHDPALVRDMTESDLKALCAAARALPALMVTLAPCAVRPGQIAALAAAGAVVSLGHAECTHAEAAAAIAEGARCGTHLFNAMSPLGNREPGLVGALLDAVHRGQAHAGIIADGVHVHPATLRVALASAGEGLFLVSDAMAVAGTALDRFMLGGREVLRAAGRLTLTDGTLAGADLSLPEAVRYLITALSVAPEAALSMAGRIPAQVIGATGGRIAAGLPADLVHFDADWRLRAVWQRGMAVGTG